MQRKRWIAAGPIALALALGAALAGCGVKGAPIPPELARPEPILDLRAVANVSGIKLSWDRPTHYVSGRSIRDLEGFVILRADGDGPLEPLVELPVTDQERFSPEREFNYVDGEAVLGRRYVYEIVSRTTDGYASVASNRVDFTRVKPSPPANPENFKLPPPPTMPAPAP